MYARPRLPCRNRFPSLPFALLIAATAVPTQGQQSLSSPNYGSVAVVTEQDSATASAHRMASRPEQDPPVHRVPNSQRSRDINSAGDGILPEEETSANLGSLRNEIEEDFRKNRASWIFTIIVSALSVFLSLYGHKLFGALAHLISWTLQKTATRAQRALTTYRQRLNIRVEQLNHDFLSADLQLSLSEVFVPITVLHAGADGYRSQPPPQQKTKQADQEKTTVVQRQHQASAEQFRCR